MAKPESKMTHEEIKELLPGYALGALHAEEAEILVRHLPTCDSCPRELAQYRQALDALPRLVPEATPQAQVKQRLMERLAPPEKRRLSWSRFALAWTPLSLLFLAGLLAVTFGLSNQLQATQDWPVVAVRLEATETAPQAVGFVLFLPRQEMAMLAVRDMPSLPSGREYQLWLTRDSEKESGGTFTVDSEGRGYLVVAMEDFLLYQGIGITMEPAGGSLVPTGDRYMFGSI